MLKLDMGDEKRSIVERLLGKAKRELALDGLEKTAIAAGIGRQRRHTSRAQPGLPPTSPTAARSSTRRKRPRTTKLYDCTKARLTQELMCIKGKTVRSWSDFAKGRSEYLTMTQTGSQYLGWAERWGVVRLVREKLEFVAFFDTREDAEAAASEAGVDCQACWLSYKDGLGFSNRGKR
jgi:hypothetical protein